MAGYDDAPIWNRSCEHTHKKNEKEEENKIMELIFDPLSER